ncbi:substrate-binding domain-containing protein [Limimaricola pyoseonensis]|uniref:DNA-binding transcriptional regulator, LacI/PurR family n=1 Tax=Limimaricola pyoseonensis TaxID=521013 RepID=A0A1G7HSC4_9RHOB|nr:substrate-binding domain-containing protein [Limimaricola pyoseonensis]SDF03397.1 DNA-binding transcriptional regulator, LacI/PurR family [Limimaricola pyoseonensis]
MAGPTGRDVARVAGVSVAAVSRAFQPDSPLAPARRARILAVARELGYKAPAERRIAEMTTGTVTLVAGDLSNPFYTTAMETLSTALHAQGRRLVLHVVPPGSSVDAVMRQVLDYRSDAAIVTSATMSSRLARACREQGMPVVLLNRVQPDAGMTAATCDNFGGGRQIAHRFIASGRRRIALIGGREDTSTHLERIRGFLDVLDESGIALFDRRSGGFTYEGGLDAAGQLFDAPTRPDALFCANDVMALAAIDAARARGMNVPDDLAVIGFDDIPMAAWSSYRLTTMRQPINRMVADALELIDLQMQDPTRAGAIRIAPVRLIERQSG